MVDKIIILQHQSGQKFNSYDILVHERHQQLVDFKDGYKLDCRYVKKFLKDNPGYLYVFSEDNGHIPEFNWILRYINNLIKDGHKLIILDEEYVENEDVDCEGDKK